MEKRILWLSQTYYGSVHDKKICDEQPLKLPSGIFIWQDTGFLGHNPENATELMPQKKPKGKELGLADKFFNRMISSVRIRVEHVIASVKRCRIVKDVFRNTKKGFSDLAMSIACALHNFRLSLRHPASKIPVSDYFR